jgi:penicillin-insensitive murein endopeptidase
MAALALNLASGVRAESVSVGTPVDGSLKGGVSLPAAGDGFVTYSRLGNWLGRQYVHTRVRDTLLDAFASLHAVHPGRIFVIGETGLKHGAGSGRTRLTRMA